jgi:hypothetical protein
MSETIAELVAKVLLDHQARFHYKAPRTTCAGCDWETCGDDDVKHKAHVAEQVQRVVDARLADAWDVGYSCGLGDCGKDQARDTCAANPYRIEGGHV